MNYATHELVQGSAAWHAHRKLHLNGSDAAAMLGLSSYKSRAQLVREYATGESPEIDAATQKRFADGHAYEAAARPLVEAEIVDDLYPATVSRAVDGLPLSSSMDGFTMDGRRTWEHKTLNDALWESLLRQEIPAEYHPQMEQCLLITGADSCLFSASRGTPETLLSVEYRSNSELRAQIITGWKQFQADVANYVCEAPKGEAVGRAPETLPALRIEVTGAVIASNLDVWRDGALAIVEAINTNLQTDDDFASAEKTVKWCADSEAKLEAAKSAAMANMESVDALFRAVDDVRETLRQKRLTLDKLVAAEKANRKADIIRAGVDAVRAHYASINATLPGYELGVPASLMADLGGAIKGLKTVASIKDKIDGAVAQAKIAASQEADRRRLCIAVIDQHAEHRALIPDAASLVAGKSPEDLRNLITARVAEHQAKVRKQAEDAAERERERIRREEEARAQREAEAKAEQERQRIREEEQAKARAEIPQAPAMAPRPTVAPAAATVMPPEPTPAAAAWPETGARVKLGDVNAAIAPLRIDAAGLAALGFQPVATEGAAKIYASLPKIVTALICHLQAVAVNQGRNAA